ncbi:MAG: substrate-binding domain-containing protein [Oscillospiraceae bacterium]|nr:substrate-binding domain-containing protein [Oscillospiraceae bacterium]
MKKVKIIVVTLVIIGCIGSFLFFTQDKFRPDSKPLFSLDDYPTVDASLATQPLATAFIKEFTGEKEISDERLGYTNTHPGYVKLIDDEVDLIIVTEPSEEELALAKEKGVELEVIPVVKEGFVFYVNSENSVDNLTLEQIQKIYTGEITNWKEVGGDDAPIRAYQRPVNSGSQTGMLSLVMKDLPLMKPVTEDIVDTMYQIINLVSSYDNGRYSIGYSYYYYATTMFQDMDASIANGITLLGVDGVKPTNETIYDGSYPIQTAYYIVIRKDEPENSKVRKLVDAMLSDKGQEIAEGAGYVPVK